MTEDCSTRTNWATRSCTFGIAAWITTICMLNYGFGNGAILRANSVLAVPLATSTVFCIWKSGTLQTFLIAMLFLAWPVLLLLDMICLMRFFDRPHLPDLAALGIFVTVILFILVFRNWSRILADTETCKIHRHLERLVFFSFLPMGTIMGLNLAFGSGAPQDGKTGLFVGSFHLSDVSTISTVVVAALCVLVGLSFLAAVLYPIVAFCRFREMWRVNTSENLNDPKGAA